MDSAKSNCTMSWLTMQNACVIPARCQVSDGLFQARVALRNAGQHMLHVQYMGDLWMFVLLFGLPKKENRPQPDQLCQTVINAKFAKKAAACYMLKG